MIKKELNITIILLPHYKSKNQEYLVILKVGLNVKLDEAVEQIEKYYEKFQIQAFAGS